MLQSGASPDLIGLNAFTGRKERSLSPLVALAASSPPDGESLLSFLPVKGKE